MADFDEADRRRRYDALAARNPGAFENADGDMIRILRESAAMREAQAQARASRLAAGLPADDVRLGVLAQDPYVTLLRDAVEFPGGGYGIYNRLLAPPGFVLVPVRDDGRIVLIRCFRHGPRRFMIELPRGMVDPGEAMFAAARRELFEETGVRGEAFVDLGEVFAITGVSAERLSVLCVRASDAAVPRDEEGIAEVLFATRAEVDAMVLDGRISDALTISALARARLAGHVI